MLHMLVCANPLMGCARGREDGDALPGNCSGAITTAAADCRHHHASPTADAIGPMRGRIVRITARRDAALHLSFELMGSKFCVAHLHPTSPPAASIVWALRPYSCMGGGYRRLVNRDDRRICSPWLPNRQSHVTNLVANFGNLLRAGQILSLIHI